MTFKVEISGFTSKVQAEQFVIWYEGQGEQHVSDWLECRARNNEADCSSLNVDCLKTYPLTWENEVLKMVVSPK